MKVISDPILSGKIITLDLITIIDKYDQDDLEQQILKKFIDFCRYMSFDYILVIAANPRKVGEKAIIEFPHVKLYQELGFSKIDGSESRAPVMIKILAEDDMFV